MGQVSAIMRRTTTGYVWWCPACQEMHPLPDGWTFNGNFDRPTFSPSFRHTGIQSVVVDGKWTGEWVRDADGKPLPWCCHYIITDGQAAYCGDCTHALSGKTVPMPPLPEGFTDA